MESKKINQLATNVNPQTSDLTTIGDPITGQLKKITWLQVANLIGAQASVTLQQVTDNGNTTTDPITTGGLTLTNLGTGVPQLTNGNFAGTYGYGLANGVATLDSGGKIPAAQLPSSVMEYKGTWNASTNTPTLADGTGDNGDVYLVNVAGSQNLGSGTISFAVGDWVVYNGTIWQKSLNSNAVASVFGRTGTIVAQEGDYNIDQLGDVAITSASTNDYLRYNGSSWVNTQFPTFVSSDKLILQVRNNSGATINKGTVVYINGATAGYPTIAKALADSDNTSAQTLGLVQDNISNNSNGVVVIVGQITGVDTSAYVAGTQLYLSGTTAGAFTSTKTLAPTHLVYVGIVTTQNAVNGVIEVKIQNGYELEEIHDVSITSVANNQGLFYESSTSLWKNKSIATVLGYTPEQPLTFSAPLSRSTNTVSIPAATGSVNGYLTSTDWTTFNNKMANPMTTLGDIIFGGTSGNPNRLAGNTTTTKQYLSQTGTGTESASPTWATIAGSDITGAALTKSDDTNVTLTLGGTPATSLLRAASLTLGWTGQLAISRGGTGASTKGAAFDALSPMSALGDLIYGGASGTGTRLSGSTSASKRFLTQTGDGTNSAAPAWGTVTASDIAGSALTKTDDTNVTLTLGGSAATALLNAASLTLGWTGQLSVARGGTGLSSLGTAGQLLRVNTGATALEYFTPTYISAAITSLNGLTAATQTFANDTNVTITSATATHTIGWSGELSIARGGTGASTKSAAFNALSPMTTLGDIIYGGASGTGTRLAGSTSASKRFLTQTGDGTISAAPAWGALASADIPNNAADTTGNAATATKLATARTITIGATGKTFDGSANVSWTLAEIGAAASGDLSNYLPLSGGTLTGALNGTVASFSKTSECIVSVDSISDTSYSAYILKENGSSKAYLEYINSAYATTARRNYLEAYNNIGGFAIYTANTKAVDIDTSQNTVFSGSINATAGLFSETISANKVAQNIRLKGGNTNALDGFVGANTDGTLYFRNWSGTYGLTMAHTTGNATFSGTVTATSFVGNSSTATKLETARNFTINGTAKSFDGSANVSWTATEIGLTNYLLLTGGTLSGTVNIEANRTTYPIPLKVDNNLGYGIYVSNDNTLNFNYGIDADSDGYINHVGYSAGVTRFRNLFISDGKQGNIAKFTGSGKTTTLYGDLTGTNAKFSNAAETIIQLNANATTGYSAITFKENDSGKAYLEYINSAFSTASRRNYLEAYNAVGGFSVWAANGLALDIDTSLQSTFKGLLTLNVSSGDHMRFIGRGASDYSDIVFYATNNSTRLGYIDWSNTQARINVEASIPFILYTNGTQRLRIDSNGDYNYGSVNVQSSNNSTYRQAFYGGMAIMWRNAADWYLDSNHTYSSSNTNVATYDSSVGIGRLYAEGGQFIWYSSGSSVTAGTAYNLNQRFTILNSGKTGISVATPNYALSVSGTLNAGYILLGDNNNGNNTTIEFVNGSNSTSYFTGQGHINYYGTASLTLCYGGGEVLIGTITDSGAYKLQVSGSVLATSGFYDTSDIRLKNVLNKIESNSFDAIEFEWKDKRDINKHWGYSAQDVLKFIPDAVKINNDGTMTVNYNEAHTWKIAQLEKEIKELKSKLN